MADIEQEHCEDAISRQAVLDLIADYDLSMGQVVRGIHALPSVSTEKKRWIPVSERLPPLRQHVLLSAYGRVIYGRLESEDGNSGYPLFYVCTSVGDSKPVYQETTVHSKFTTSRINAWMPLPEPYKAESEE